MRMRPRSEVVFLVLACCLAVAFAGCREPSRDDQASDTMRRTEGIRGLAALEPVKVRFLPRREAFDELLEEWRGSDDAAAAVAEAVVMERLGLLPPAFDILAALEWSTRTGVLGYYEPDEDRMTIVAEGDEVASEGLWVLAHEHAHALQDQHFGLDAEDGLDTDQAAALDALAEGEATLVGAVFMVKRLGISGLEELDELPTDVMPVAGIPPILNREGEFPYLDGAAFVFHHWDGDWSTVDSLWADPPVSTEQIMHPERYPHDKPIVIELPDIAPAMGPAWQQSDELVLGEMRIGVLLADGGTWDYGDEDAAFAHPRLPQRGAAEGWGGDRLAYLTGPTGRWAIVWQTAWDSVADAEEFAVAARAAFEDLPYDVAIDADTDVTTGELAYPVLATIASDRGTRAALRAALGLD